MVRKIIRRLGSLTSRPRKVTALGAKWVRDLGVAQAESDLPKVASIESHTHNLHATQDRLQQSETEKLESTRKIETTGSQAVSLDTTRIRKHGSHPRSRRRRSSGSTHRSRPQQHPTQEIALIEDPKTTETQIDVTLVARMESILGRTFTNKEVLREALQIPASREIDNNRRLALLGDSVVNQVLTEDWYYLGHARVHQGNARRSILSNDSLAIAGNHFGISKYLQKDPSNGNNRLTVIQVATAVEAVLGATFVESGRDFAAVRQVMKRMGLTYEAYLTNNGPKIT